MTAPAKQQALNDDGTPKRRYELEEVEDSKVGIRSAIGLVLVNAFVLVKNALFWDEAAAQRSEPGVAANGVGKAAADDGVTTALDDTPDASSDDETDDEDADSAAGSASSIHLLAPRDSFEPEDSADYAHRHSSGRPASNDNEALYGAAPGGAVDLGHAGEAHSPSRHAAGGGSGSPGANTSDGGGGGDDEVVSDDGDDENDDVDDLDDDDDDDGGPGRPNRLPVVTGPVILASLLADQSVVIFLSDLLRNASDPDGDPLSVRELTASSGTLLQRDETSWTFTPEVNDTSSVSFAYAVSDGKGAVVQHASLDLVARSPGHIEGTAAADTLIGTPRDDIIVALGGDDTVLAREGNDIVYGGDGNDRIIAGDGNDVVYAGAGDDVVFAGKGDDVVFGGEGNDIVFGEEGNDTLVGEEGKDVLSGGDGNDIIAGGADDDTLQGDSGDDVIDGGMGRDEIAGGDGSDVVQAGAGDDKAFGGDGDDVFIAFAGDGDDTYDGGEGSDTYDASGTTADATFDLRAGVARSADIGADTIGVFETVLGGSGNDLFIANDRVNIFAGGSGDDLFVFGSTHAAGVGAGGRDRILDFAVGDRIDLYDISEEFAQAIETTFEDQGLRKFVLVSQQLEFSRPGQMKVQYEAIDDHQVSILEGNVDYDPDVDFQLEIAGIHEFNDNDFYWRA